MDEKQLMAFAAEITRFHILETITELEKWIQSGRTVEQYIILKRALYEPN